MGGIDFSALGLLLGAGGGLLCFWLGRKLRQKRLDARRERDQALRRADETRQVRRARERREGPR